jgi:hypothetical protein
MRQCIFSETPFERLSEEIDHLSPNPWKYRSQSASNCNSAVRIKLAGHLPSTDRGVKVFLSPSLPEPAPEYTPRLEVISPEGR